MTTDEIEALIEVRKRMPADCRVKPGDYTRLADGRVIYVTACDREGLPVAVSWKKPS